VDFALRDLNALSRARRGGTGLDRERAKKAASEPEPSDESPNIATALEALRAVLPATFVALYTTGVILLQNLAQATGASGRAREQVALAATHANSEAALEAALQALSVEPRDLSAIRVAFAVVSTILLAFYAYQKAQVPNEPRVVLEPSVVTGAFVAWALAAPGTFLAAYLNSTQLAATTIIVAVLAALALFVLGATVLNRPSESGS
jgi:hypothetical protein